MSARLFIVVGSAAAAIAGGWLLLRPPELEPIETGTEQAATLSGSSRAAVTSSATSAPPETARAAAPAAARVVIAAPPPTLFNEYLGARQYRILYDRLAHSPQAQTAEGKLVLYEILRQCATVTEGARPGYKANPPRREDFIAGIPANDPQREQRIAAFDEFALDRCKGFEGMTVTRAALIRLLDEAAAAGDPHARALAMEQALWQQRRSGGGTLTDGQVESLREILGTRNPEAVRVAGRILANSWNDYQLRLGPEQLPVEQRAFVNAFLVLSCELGAPCGADTPRMLEACAMRGHCSAQNFPDYLYFYGSTPHDAGLLTRYREIVRNAIETNNWSQFHVVRGVPPNRNRMTFVPGPR